MIKTRFEILVILFLELPYFKSVDINIIPIGTGAFIMQFTDS